MQQDEDDRHNVTGEDQDTPEYRHPSGGWGSLRGVARIFGEEHGRPEALEVLSRLNKPAGVACPSCAWAKPGRPHTFEFCENGAKAVLWELTPARCTPELFAAHTVTELREWRDHDLEQAGRLTHPMRYDPDSDRYVAVKWEDAFAEIGRELKAIDPKTAVFYASGHAGLEASYLYALFARIYGHQNLPQSSNMCHETTSVNLMTLIGTPVGTCTFDDFDHCDAIFFFGQNTGSNSPRFLHNLKDAVERGCRIVTFNPVRERGLVQFVDPQNLVQMTVGRPTKISEQYYQVRPGGDVAVLAGMIKLVLDAEARSPGAVLDHDFISEQTNGFEAMKSALEGYGWDDIERRSGLSRSMIESATEVYLSAKSVIGIFGMGLTQHVNGWLNLGMLVNLLMLRGNLGRLGTGVSPVRGHSNVQGQRTVGVGEKSTHMPLDKLERMFDVELPREDGMNAVHASRGILDGSVNALISLGGNLLRALPDSARMEDAWPKLRLSVNIATRLNRSHLRPGQVSYLLPCLARTDEDVQGGRRQTISVEDTLSHIYGSIGSAKPASAHLKSEVAIITGIAKETVPPNPKLRWDDWTADYALIRDLIEATYGEMFHNFNERLYVRGGFYRGNPVRDRRWETASGKAEFTAPTILTALGMDVGEPGDDPALMTLVTLRSNDQFNTTIYGFSDRLRGLHGSRDIVLIDRDEMARLGLEEGQKVTLVCAVDDGLDRRVGGLTITAYDLPHRCVAGYYPELNPLIPLGYHEVNSGTPAYKGTPVRIVAE